MNTLDDYKTALEPLTRYGLAFTYRQATDWQADYEIRLIAGRTFRVLNDSTWAERDGTATGADPASLADLIARRTARDLIRAAETGDGRTVCMTRLAYEGAEPMAVIDIRETARMTVCRWRGRHTPWRQRRFKGTIRSIGLTLALTLEP